MWAVIGALVANGLITVFKGIGFAVTGSASMGAEALHSLADTTNQVFLLLGLRFYKRPATEKHPFGYGMERFFRSFIAAIFIFGVGSTYAIYEGIEKLRHHEQPQNLKWAYIILGVSFVLEAASIGLAIWQEVTEAHHEGMTFMEYLRESKDPTVKTVLFEDSAALLGIVIAATGIYLTEHHAGPGGGAYWDGLASITIGVVLAIVAFVLARMSRGLLLGEAATPRTVERIRQAILEHPHVVQVVELLTMHLAPKQILINAHINLRDDLATDDIEQTITEIEELIKRAEPKVHMVFLETARESQSEMREPLAQHMG
jgi:cation diffusion facilitator family transporter